MRIVTKHKNTLQRGSVRFIVFEESGVWYAAALEFNIVESGDTPAEAMLLLFEAVSGYVEAARKVKLRPSVLNQAANPEYEDMWDNRRGNKVFSSGELSIGGLRRSLAAV